MSAITNLDALLKKHKSSLLLSPVPQLVVPGILNAIECITLDVISKFLFGDPLAIALCEAVVPPHRSVIKTRTTTISIQPRYRSSTNVIGGISFQDSADKSIYGCTPLPESKFVRNHCGYIYVRQTGSYTFTLGEVDAATFIRVGSTAYSKWTVANADAKALYDNGPARGIYTINLREGYYYAFRIFTTRVRVSPTSTST
ncbi:hypothetical protein TASIC1_0003071600 [Trichoderma asperellum]|uniref:GLEYA adhesin domain-containing protein n=1 Tax=Trichoderma asperellum TaxID=101201 RepID=A0A6V8QP94_TRIAP|nr:hypothetical protein TASIC1_0003071600 [Trichoderma asperellum]